MGGLATHDVQLLVERNGAEVVARRPLRFERCVHPRVCNSQPATASATRSTPKEHGAALRTATICRLPHVVQQAGRADAAQDVNLHHARRLASRRQPAALDTAGHHGGDRAEQRTAVLVDTVANAARADQDAVARCCHSSPSGVAHTSFRYSPTDPVPPITSNCDGSSVYRGPSGAAPMPRPASSSLRPVTPRSHAAMPAPDGVATRDGGRYTATPWACRAGHCACSAAANQYSGMRASEGAGGV